MSEPTVETRQRRKQSAADDAGDAVAHDGAVAVAQQGVAAGEREQRLGQAMTAAAAALVVGLAMVGTGHRVLGAPLTVVGLLALVAVIHFYGRLGAPPPAADPSDEPAG